MTALAELQIAYPDLCTRCGGWGYIVTGPMERDTGAVPTHPCPSCTDVDECPYCGRPILFVDTEDRAVCFSCGWDETAHGAEDALPVWEGPMP